ncbi:40S ribosomal protein s7 [Phtheirospermum japonicum]|uniref:40S ribosomal protein s7 n=1 Tax=Phtheirospermum japonicum TaxID=374723 RepID=A0A830C506_9LAMI|nr:40S ribosomal protein s7 [Phtheirospermum japonicum]
MALLLRGPKYAHSLLCMMLCSRILFILLRLWGKHTRYRLDGSKIMKVVFFVCFFNFYFQLILLVIF